MMGNPLITLEKARASRDIGIARAGDHADAVGPAWTERAAELVRQYAARSPLPFLAEEVVAWAGSRIEPPPDGRAWGAAFRRAQKDGYVVQAGFARARTSHLSPKILWQRALCPATG